MMTRAMLEGILAGVAALVSVPIVIFFLECVAALWPRRMPAAPTAPAQEKPLAVLIPAHDEEAGIAETVRGIRAQSKPGDRVLVVADNCGDATAAQRATRASNILYHHLLSKRPAHMFRHDAGHDITWAAGRKWDNHSDGLRRISLCKASVRHAAQSKNGERHQTGDQSTHPALLLLQTIVLCPH